VWTVDGCCDSGVAKSLELFGTDVDDVDDVRPSSSNATRCRERTTQQKNENVESNDERKRMRRTRLAEPRWSSGFSSASHNSLSERSPSPIFPSTSQCSVADDLASLVAVAESEVDTKGQMSPVFDKSLQNSSAFEDPGTGLAGHSRSTVAVRREVLLAEPHKQ
jgi:hypothetical protein